LLAGTGISIARDDGRTIILRLQKKADAGAPKRPIFVAALQTNPAPERGSSQAVQIAEAAPPTIQAEAAPEQVLITGSLIHGAESVGAPVTTLSDSDFKQTGALTVSDLFKNIPSVQIPASVNVTDGGGFIERGQNVNIRGLSQKGARTLLLVDGMRFPNQGDGGCQVDPSIIPQIAIDRVDLLADGASATYGSDAIAGVVNVTLKRHFDGALTQLQFGGSPDIGHLVESASQLYGKVWDGGDVTVSYEWYNQAHVSGTARPRFTQDFFSAAGLDNRMLISNAAPAILSVGAAKAPTGTPAGFSATQGLTCANCFSVPRGQNGIGLTWAQVLANPGVANELNLFSAGWAMPDQTRNAATLTFDQKIWDGVSLFADGWYSDRRSTMLEPGGRSSQAPATNNAFTITVPTTNPFYPVGAPSGLSVNYDLSYEMPLRIEASEAAARYDFGLNLTLPYDWTGKIYYSDSQDRERASGLNAANLNMVSAAVGNTVAPAPANGLVAGQASFTKPANVPYLNLFCDPTAFTCNDAATLQYISGFRNYRETTYIDEYGANADGAIADLPGGQIKAAIGALYTHFSYDDADIENYNNANTGVISNLTEHRTRTLYSTFGQINIPIFGDANKLPFLEQLQVEGSLRYDHYNDFGSTTNPKVAVNWGLGYGLTLRGTWGTAFRAPSFQEAGAISGTILQPINQPAGAATNNIATCPVAGLPAVPGSVAALIDPNCSASLQFLGGIRLGNGAGIASAIRPTDFKLGPEKAQNISTGFEYAPTDNLLKGLDVQATYWFVKIRQKLQGYLPLSGPTSGQLDDPNYAAAYLTAANDPNFQSDVLALLANPRSTLPGSSVASSISFIADGAIRNIGWQSVNGVDFNTSYERDFGDFGAWNIGVTGTYYIDNKSQGGPGQSVVSFYRTPVNGHVDSGGRLNYRARLGWANESGWSVTGFMNFIPHFASGSAVLPPSCFLAGNTPCNASGLPQFAQYTQQFPFLNSVVPGAYTFDLSIGYNTGQQPANRYLKNIGLQLTINNLLDKQPPFQYSVATGSNTPHAFYSTTSGQAISPDGRFITLVISKTW